MTGQPVRVARVSTVSFFVVTQLASQLDALVANGFEVTAIASEDEFSKSLRKHRGLAFLPVEIPRKISLLKDLRALLRLVRVFRKERFDIVHSTTPKAGLLCALAGRIAGVPVRLHTYTGQPWVSLTGLKRSIARGCDTLVGRMNTLCYADSPSQLEFLVDNRIVDRARISVIGSGSLAGVDVRRFDPQRYPPEASRALRQRLGIPLEAVVMLFVGRVTRDKGVAELTQAFAQLREQGLDVYLVVIGPFEPDADQVLSGAAEGQQNSHIKVLGYCEEPEAYMAMADVFCLPSYREGFGTVVIEAAAMGLPAVGTRIYGLTDSILEGETGLLVPVGDVPALRSALERLATDEGLRRRLGRKASERARSLFADRVVSELLVEEYRKLLAAAPIRKPSRQNLEGPSR